MNSPIVVIDARSPEEALENLSKDFSVIPFITKNITYDAIAGHPDIFIAQNGSDFIIAPNTPKEIQDQLQKRNNIHIGEKIVGTSLPDSTPYNCLITNSFIFHKRGYTDKTIKEENTTKQFIELPQAYTRCSLFEIAENVFITSDQGISSVLERLHLEHLYISPIDINLPPYKNGFIGGCLGKYHDTIYINGSLSKHKDGERIQSFIFSHKCKIVELHRGELYDGGGIFFLD